MQYAKDEIIARLYNWQVIFNGEYIEAQMKGTDGTWRWLDCAYECIHCGICLGCLRKGIFDEDDHGNIMINDYRVCCEESPNGRHEYNP